MLGSPLQDVQTSGLSRSDGMCRLENPIPDMILPQGKGQIRNGEWQRAPCHRVSPDLLKVLS